MSQVVRGLSAAVNEKVAMRFIVSCKLMARCQLLLHFASLEIAYQSHNYYEGSMQIIIRTCIIPPHE